METHLFALGEDSHEGDRVIVQIFVGINSRGNQYTHNWRLNIKNNIIKNMELTLELNFNFYLNTLNFIQMINILMVNLLWNYFYYIILTDCMN